MKYNIDHAAGMIGVSRSTLYLWIKHGKVPVTRDGSRYWLEENTIETVRTLFADHGFQWFKYAPWREVDDE